MFYAQNSLFVFDGFYNMGQNGFLFFAEFLGVTPHQASAAYPPPPVMPAGDRQPPGLALLDPYGYATMGILYKYPHKLLSIF
jgi:hypothetical protein